MATISLNDYLLKKIPIHVGDELIYSGFIHGSVGKGLDYKLPQNDIVVFQNYTSRYHNPENMKKGWTGGDAATGTYTFEAKNVGKTSLMLLHLFRGEIEVCHELDIIVEEQR